MPGANRIGVQCEDKVRAAITTNKNATSVKVLLGDEVVKEIELGHSRRRASQFLETLARIGNWSSLDLVGKSGKTIAVVENDGEAGPIEDLGATSSTREQRIFESAMRICVEGVLRGQREVLSYRSKEVDTVMQAVASSVKELTGALHAVNEAHAIERESLIEAADRRVESAQKGGRDWAEQFADAAEAAAEAVPQLAPAVFAVKAALTPKRAAAGAPSSTAKPGANGSPAKGD